MKNGKFFHKGQKPLRCSHEGESFVLKDTASEDVGSKISRISQCTGDTEEINEEQ